MGDSKTRQRIHWIDLAKGIATILVVVGHVADGYINAVLFPENLDALNSVFEFIYSFHMPLFFVISGYVFKKVYLANGTLNKQNTKSQIYNLIYIYILFSLLLGFMKIFFAQNVNNPISCADLYKIFVKPIGPFWYLYVLIFYYLIHFVFWKEKLSKLLVAISIIANIYSNLFDFDTGFPIKLLLYHMLFFEIGVVLKDEFLWRDKKWSWMFCVFSFLLCTYIIVMQFNPRFVFGLNMIVAIIISMSILILCKKCNDNILLEYVGKHSLEIYVLHCFITAANRKIFMFLGLSNIYMHFILNVILAIALPVLFTMFLKKNHLYEFVFKPIKFLSRRGNV